MSAYTTQASITGQMGAAGLLQALDDNGSGNLNTTVLNQIISDVSSDIDGLLGGLYQTPFNPIPPMVASAALAICCYEIMRRALTPEEKNTFKADADYWWKTLTAVRDDDAPFDVNTNRVYAPFIVQSCCLSVDMTTG